MQFYKWMRCGARNISGTYGNDSRLNDYYMKFSAIHDDKTTIAIILYRGGHRTMGRR